jgi:hypothetical protein
MPVTIVAVSVNFLQEGKPLSVRRVAHSEAVPQHKGLGVVRATQEPQVRVVQLPQDRGVAGSVVRWLVWQGVLLTVLRDGEPVAVKAGG